MLTHVLRFCFAAIAALVLAGCATRATTIDAQWVSPSIAGKRDLRSVLVLGALRDTTHRRMLEDRMVDALAAVGVKAVASYKYLPDGGQLSEDQLRKVVAAAGASHVLATSITGMTTDVRVTPGMVSGPGWGPGRGWPSTMGPGWGGFASYHNTAWVRSTPPDVRTTRNVHGDTRVFDAAKSEVVWSAATTTAIGWDSVPQLMDQFVGLIVETLKQDGVI
ncbi:MAG: hypothetical protein ACM3O5_00860 [Betaproteobacteria bacterium]